MFFGDIICGNPEFIKKLPENTLCLTWGYAPDQREDECRAMAQAGARQYLCPGVCGWNQWMNMIENSYKNITRMCAYGQKYQAEGILNTDWGDFGHVNDSMRKRHHISFPAPKSGLRRSIVRYRFSSTETTQKRSWGLWRS